MSLFVLHHQHDAARCPAQDPQAAAMLLAHLAPDNAAQYGITIQGHGVVDGQHTLYVIAEAGDQESMQRFAAPFAQAGQVDVLPASLCEAVVARGGCAVLA
jgi:hypothetical protein